MSDMTDVTVAARALADPLTPAANLADIAQAHPSLRSSVALHPNVYPGLLDYLDMLGDPVVSAAVATRRAGGQRVMQGPPPPLGGPWAPGPNAVGAFDQSVTTPRTVEPIIAGVLFFVRAALSTVLLLYSLSRLPEPLRYHPATLFSLVGLLVPVACGIVSLMVGRKSVASAGFLIAVILVASETVFFFRGLLSKISLWTNYGHWDWSSTAGSLLHLAIPIILLVLMRSRTVETLRNSRTLLLVVMALALIGPQVVSVIVDGEPFGLPLFLTNNISNVLLFAALLVLAFALKDPAQPQPVMTTHPVGAPVATPIPRA